MKPTAKDIRKIQSIINDEELDSFIGTYDNEDMLVVTGWDDVDKIKKHFRRELDRVIDYGFDDEYSTCGGCNKIIRTSPTHYGWKPDYLFLDGVGYVCSDCLTFDDIETCCDNDPNKANTIFKDADFVNHGYTHLTDDGYSFETGFHEGMDADPKKVYDTLKNKYEHVIFSIDANSQFYTSWSVYVKN
jgi:hypothetical protein